MKKKKMEEELTATNFDIDESEFDTTEIFVPEQIQPQTKAKKEITEETTTNCLRNERIIVRFLVKKNGVWGDNPKHVLAGGMSDNSVRTFVVPRLASGKLVNVLTDSEKAFLEEIMGLEYNALSIYKTTNNFWDDSNDMGVNKVKLQKQDNYLNLADPEDYIRYKILLANKDFIAPSLQAYHDMPKATYQFVLISEEEETRVARGNMNSTMKCYVEFGKIEDNVDALRVVIETLDGRPTSPTAKLEFLQTKANELIQKDSKMFLSVITDPLLNTKVLIKKCIEAGIIAPRGNQLYLRADGTPLCENNEEPTLSIAAKYLNSPRHQDVLFALQAKLK